MVAPGTDQFHLYKASPEMPGNSLYNCDPKSHLFKGNVVEALTFYLSAIEKRSGNLIEMPSMPFTVVVDNSFGKQYNRR